MNKVYAFQIKNLNILKGENELATPEQPVSLDSYFDSLNTGK